MSLSLTSKFNRINFRQLLIIILLTNSCSIILSQETKSELKKLNFLIGNWKSTSYNIITGDESTGISSIGWILNGKWLQWEFKSEMERGNVEVLTLINYNIEKGQYAFYSINSENENILPHFGNWLNDTTLRLEIIENSQKIYVDFVLEEGGDFKQIHSKLISKSRVLPMRETFYIK